MRLKNGAERYRQNILEPNFQKHILFQFKVHDNVHDKVHDKVHDTFLDQASWLILGFMILANVSKR